MWTRKLARPIPPLFESMVDVGIRDWLPAALNFSCRLTARRLIATDVSYQIDEVDKLRRLLAHHIHADPTYLPSFILRCRAQSTQLVCLARDLGQSYLNPALPVDTLLLVDWWSRYVEEFTKTAPFLAVFPAALDDVLEDCGQMTRLPSALYAKKPGCYSPQLKTYAAQERQTFNDLIHDIQSDVDLIELFASATTDELLTSLPRQSPDLVSRLESHLERFSWMSINYFVGEPCSLGDLIDRLKQYVSHEASKPSPDFTAVSSSGHDLEQELIDIRTYRKDAMELSGFYMRSIFQAIAELMGIAYADLLLLSAEEVHQYLFDTAGSSHLPSIIKQRQQGVIVEMISGYITVRATESHGVACPMEETDVLRGQVGYPGYCEGIARVLRTSEEANRVQQGDVLVVRVLTPNFYIAYGRAGAIVTDEGGVTSHAVAVSRERHIPCVISTQRATRVFRDGQRIAVEALGQWGIVKNLSQSGKAGA